MYSTQIAYIGVISPAHKELVHLMLDAGKVWFYRILKWKVNEVQQKFFSSID